MTRDAAVSNLPMVSYTKYSDIEVFEGKIAKHQYPWHFHNCYTLIIVEDGSINYEFQDTSLRINEAEAIIIEPYKIHRNSISQPTDYKALFLPIQYLEFLGKNKLVTQKVNYPNVVDGIVDLLDKIELKYSKNELKEIVFGLFQLIDHPQIEKNHDFPSGINIIPKIDLDLSITELAEEASLSKFHFQRKFKKKCGLTIGQLKQQEKTKIAKTLLENGKLSTDVAYELGFFDQSHFIKYFKKMWAITPKNFK